MSHKRKHPSSSSRGRDHAKIVANHYDVNKEERGDRNKSRIFVMRSFNNWVKQIQIENSFTYLKEHNADEIFEERVDENTGLTKQRCKGLQILDWCCGKGGDQSKWKKVPVRHIDFVDISGESVKECERRYNNNRQCRDKYSAKFYVQDCCLPVEHRELSKLYSARIL